MARSFTGKRVLVIGHTGFKGSWLAMALSAVGAEVWGYSREQPRDRRHVYHELQLSQHVANPTTQFGDVRDFDCLRAVYDEARPELTFHVAAQAIVSEGYQDPHFTLGTNSMGVVNSLEAHRRNLTSGPLVVVTSDKAYRNQESSRPYTEEDVLFGDDPYSASKAMAELAVHTYAFSFPEMRRKGLASVRAGNVFGGGDWSPNRLVPDCVRQLEASGAISLRMPQAVRPWTYVLDVVFGYLLVATALMESPENASGAWNFASGEALTVMDIADTVSSSWSPPGEIRIDELPIGHETTLLQIDATKAKRYLGWTALTPVDASLRRTAAWYLAQSRGEDVSPDSIDEISRYWRTYDERTRSGAHRLRWPQPDSVV